MLLVQVHFFWIERLLCLMAAVWPGLQFFLKSFATPAFLGATSHDPQVCRWKRNHFSHFSQLRDTLAAHGNRKSWPGLSKALAKTAGPPWSSWPQYGIQWISQRHSPVVFPGRSDPYFKGGRWQLSCWGQEFQDEGVRFRPVPSVTWCSQFWLGTLHCSICQSSWVDSMTHWYRLIPTFLQSVYRPFTCIMHPYTMIFKHFKQRAWYYDPEVHPAFRCIGTAELPTAQGWGLAMKMCVRGCLALIRSHTEPDNALFMCLWTPNNSSMGLEQAPPLLSPVCACIMRQAKPKGAGERIPTVPCDSLHFWLCSRGCQGFRSRHWSLARTQPHMVGWWGRNRKVRCLKQDMKWHRNGKERQIQKKKIIKLSRQSFMSVGCNAWTMLTYCDIINLRNIIHFCSLAQNTWGPGAQLRASVRKPMCKDTGERGSRSWMSWNALRPFKSYRKIAIHTVTYSVKNIWSRANWCVHLKSTNFE